MLKRIRAGEPFKASARTWNAFAAMAEAFQAQQRAQHVGPSDDFYAPGVVKIQNGTGAVLRVGEVVDLVTLPLSGSPDHRYPWFTGQTPNEQRVSAVMLSPAPNDATWIGDAQLVGVCPALVNFTDTTHKFARVSTGDRVLQSNADSGPVRIVVGPGATGEQLVWVALGDAGVQPPPLGVPFYNNSGELMPPGALIRVAEGSIDIDGVTHIEGLKPNADFYNFYLINGPAPVAVLGTGTGSFLTDLVGGVHIGDMTTPTTNDSYGPRKNQWGLFRDRPGFAPLSDDVKTITGYRQGYFKQREINDVYGRYYDTLSPGGSALFEIWIRENNELKNSGWNKIQVFDHDWLEDDEEVEPNTIGKAHFYSQVWEAGLTKCTSQNVSGSEGGVPIMQATAQEQNNATAVGLATPPLDPDADGLFTALNLPI